ncbi:MAG: ABC transporter ATP-binding protein [Alphaproteobacteria bacterium]|nr:ABC transporter ATP-binding protein [Alphaproteobacteria bacterium]
MQKTAGKFIWHYLKKFKILLGSVILLTSISRLFSQGAQYYIAKLFDYMASSVGEVGYWQNILLFIGTAAALEMAGSGLQSVGVWFSSVIVPPIRSLVIRDTFDYVNRHSISYFTNEMTGNISNKFHQLQNGVVEFLYQANHSMQDFLYAVITLGILSCINWILGLGVIIWCVLLAGQGVYFGRRRAALAKQTTTNQSRTNAAVVDAISNYAEIKSFANYRFERTNLLNILRDWRCAETIEQKAKVKIMACLEFSAIISVVLFVLINVWLLYCQKIDVTTFIFVLTTFNRLSWAAFSVNWAFNHLSRIFGQINSALETLAIEPEILDLPAAQPLKIKKADIRFADVDFSYNASQKIFDKFNLSIKAGEKVGIVGSSGAGKSTLIKLISRYFDVTGGAIFINDIDIRNATQDSLHKNIAVMPQDICLFNRTIMDNIRYGDTSASDDAIIKAARAASVDKFIEQLPKSYQTKVGDRGVILSGGERQRIAIARAILKNAPILIFDEATSSLDSESEKYIQQSLKSLMKNKTVVAIAHRLSTLREMDRIIVMDKGKIVEEGSHLSLLRKKGRYAKLFKLQADGYLRVN